MVIKNAPDKMFPIVIIGLGILSFIGASLASEQVPPSETLWGIGLPEIFILFGGTLVLLGLYLFYQSLTKKIIYTLDNNGIHVHSKNKFYSYKELGYYKHFITRHRAIENHFIQIFDKNGQKKFTISVPIDVSAYQIMKILNRHLTKHD